MKKRMLLMSALLLALLLLAGCGGQKETEEGEETSAPETEETLPPETEPPVPVFDFDEPTASKQTAPDDAVVVDTIASKYLAGGGDGVALRPTEPHIVVSGFPCFEANRNKFYRLPLTDGVTYPSGVVNHANKASGGRVRFRTDSKSVTLSVTYGTFTGTALNNNALSGVGGFDVYLGSGSEKTFLKTVVPDAKKTTFSEKIELDGTMQDVMIEMPYFAEVASLSLSFEKGSKIASPTPYTYEKPVLFYGSSITHGIAATKPANAYPAILSRMLDTEYINLGFSGAAKGEESMAKFIASLDMSVFVYDYDYNADNVDALNATHYNFYKIVRDAHPDLPIILMTKCNVAMSDSDGNAQRRAVIRRTYERAVSEGDKNIYFIDGSYVYPILGRDVCWGDGTHPDDTGFYFMARAVYPVLKALLEGSAVEQPAVLEAPAQFYTAEKSTAANDDANAVKVDDIDPTYIASKRNGADLKITEPHMVLSGFPFFDEATGKLNRLNVTDGISDALKASAAKTTGGRIRFRTNSSKLVITVRLGEFSATLKNICNNGVCGVDVYTGNGTAKTWLKTADITNGVRSYTLEVALDGTMTDVTVNLPYYAEISDITIGFTKGSKIASPTPYAYEKPIVFFGSEEILGVNACRPGNVAAEMVTRTLDANLVNFGFDYTDADRALLAEKIASLDMTALVYAYSGSETDANLHTEFYQKIRAAKPDLPILFVSEVTLDFDASEEEKKPSEALKEAYRKAVEGGDTNVFFLDGRYVLPKDFRDLCSDDGEAINDLGQYYFASALYEALKPILANS